MATIEEKIEAEIAASGKTPLTDERLQEMRETAAMVLTAMGEPPGWRSFLKDYGQGQPPHVLAAKPVSPWEYAQTAPPPPLYDSPTPMYDIEFVVHASAVIGSPGDVLYDPDTPVQVLLLLQKGGMPGQKIELMMPASQAQAFVPGSRFGVQLR